jgi:cytochrome c-type biogenesis protein CcmH/NrfF
MTSWPISRISQVALIAILTIVAGMVSLGADDAPARFDRDSHKMMCICGCNQLLGECNHVGCPNSDAMRKQLAASIAKGESDDTIFHEFQEQYGPAALASPMFTPFNHLAWIVPPLVLFLGAGVTMLLVRKWRLHTVPMPPPRLGADDAAIRNRIRRETEI